MKKLLTLLFLATSIACRAQFVIDTSVIKQSFLQMPTVTPMDGKAYIPVLVNGYPNWITPSLYEFQADSVNQSKTVLTIGKDTTKGTVYDVNSYITVMKLPVGNALQIRYSYYDENGIACTFATPAVNAVNNHSRYQPYHIVCKRGTVITFSIIFSGNAPPAGSVFYNVGCDSRLVR